MLACTRVAVTFQNKQDYEDKLRMTDSGVCNCRELDLFAPTVDRTYYNISSLFVVLFMNPFLLTFNVCSLLTITPLWN